jgi:hypothetical protein
MSRKEITTYILLGFGLLANVASIIGVWIGYLSAPSSIRPTILCGLWTVGLISSTLVYLFAGWLVFRHAKTTNATEHGKGQIDEPSLSGRTEKLAVNLLRFLKEQGPEPEKPSTGSDRRETDERWLRYSAEKMEHNRKVDSLYLAHHASMVSTIRHELRAHGANIPDLDGLVDNPYHDHGAVHRLAVRLLEVAAAMRTDELIKAV